MSLVARTAVILLAGCALAMWTPVRAAFSQDGARTPPALMHVVDRVVLPAADGSGANPARAAFCGRSRIVVFLERPRRLALFDSTGRALWSREHGAFVESLQCSGDTIALLENVDGWSLHLFNSATGRALAQADVETSRGDVAEVIGWTGRAWAIEILSRYFVSGSVQAMPFQRRTTILHDRRANVIAPSFVRIDSTPQVIPSGDASGTRLPVRPPFAPTPAIAVDATGRFFASSGRTRTVAILDVKGVRVGDIAFTDSAAVRTAEQRARLVDQWNVRYRAVWPDSLRARAIALDDGGRGAVLGRLLAAPSGALLVQRRDVEENPLARDAERLFDVVSESGRIRGRLRVPAGTNVEGFTGDLVLLLRRSQGPTPRTEVVVAALRGAS
jgi:hypothetical protein